MIIDLIIVGLVLAGCGSLSLTSLPVPSPVISTPSPTPWLLQVKLVDWDEQEPISREQLLQLVPNESTLQDMYALVGYPSAKANLSNGVVLRYASELGKLPHTVLVDGVTGKVLFVAVYDFHKNFFYLSTLKAKYGEPVFADTIYQRDHLFFPESGVAVITGHDDNNDIWHVQYLPMGTTLEDYRENQGYWAETFAFTP